MNKHNQAKAGRPLPVAVWVAILAIAALPVAAQSWQSQNSNTTASLRGVSAVSKKVAWASGTAGTVLRTTDGGGTWEVSTVPGAEQLDFRDIEAFDDHNAIVLAIGPGTKSRIYRTEDGGAHWSQVMQNSNPKGFWDCMAWWDTKHGMVIGDPVNDNFELLITTDGGTTWINGEAPAKPNEGAFAASGTCIAVEGTYREARTRSGSELQARVWFATGGAVAHVFRSGNAGASWTAATPPVLSGPASAGIFSLAFSNDSDGVAVGGDYQKPNQTRGNVAITKDGGTSWESPDGVVPRGFRSAVAYDHGGKLWVAVGTSGSDYSKDNGKTWQPIDAENYNALSFAPDGAGWAVGPKGKIAAWVAPKHKSRFRPRLP